MPEPLSPQEVTAIGLLAEHAGKALHALALGLVRPDLRDEVPRLQSSAKHAATVARDSLGRFVERIGGVRP
jgi:hypothetical protein